MKKPGGRQWLVVLAFVLVLSFTGLFAVRTVRREILGNLSWVVVGLIVTLILGWQLFRSVRPKPEPDPG